MDRLNVEQAWKFASVQQPAVDLTDPSAARALAASKCVQRMPDNCRHKLGLRLIMRYHARGGEKVRM
jgi:hypothetical protein